MKDRYERKHRRTARNPEAVRMMANADFSREPPLADVLTREFIAEVNGHRIYRDSDGKFFLWTAGVWWGFYLRSEGDARRTCEAVSP